MRALWILLIAAPIGLAGACATGGPASGRPVVMLYAAASLREALQRASAVCEEATGAKLELNVGASDDLARQIESAGKADLFFSADEATMDWLAAAGMIDGPSRRPVLSNRLVVVGPAGDGAPAAFRSPSDLAGPTVRRLSLADPDAVPAGRYAKAWLQRAGLWEAVKQRVVPALDARAALAAVESGGAQAGVVYRTDAALSARVRVLYEVGESEAPPISYPIAALRDRPHPELSRKVADCLAGARAGDIFRKAGFLVRGAAS